MVAPTRSYDEQTRSPDNTYFFYKTAQRSCIAITKIENGRSFLSRSLTRTAASLRPRISVATTSSRRTFARPSTTRIHRPLAIVLHFRWFLAKRQLRLCESCHRLIFRPFLSFGPFFSLPMALFRPRHCHVLSRGTS